MLRVVQETRPRWVIGENVAGIIRMGLDAVLADLEAEGYTCQSFVIPACGIGAQHRRDRVWIIGYSEHNGLLTGQIRGSRQSRNDNSQTRQIEAEQSERSGLSPVVADSERITWWGDEFGRVGDEWEILKKQENRKQSATQSCSGSQNRDDSNTTGKRPQGHAESDCCQSGSGERLQPQYARTHGDLPQQSSPNTDSAGHEKQQLSTFVGDVGKGGVWQSMPDPQRAGRSGQAQPGVCRGADGIPERMDPVIENCFDVPAWVAKDETGPNYKNRIKALGNSIVPQVVYQIFKAIQQVENDTLRNIR